MSSLETYSLANKPLKRALKASHFSIFSAGQYVWGGGTRNWGP